MQAVVIGTAPGREAWVKDCLESLDGADYPIIVLTQYDYELGKIKWVYQHTNITEFLFLQDSCVVKDLQLLDMVFRHHGSVSITNVPSFFGCYLGKYRREILDKMSFPNIPNKEEAVRHETDWTRRYTQADKDTMNLFDDFDIPENHYFAERHGRKNLVLENDYLIKYKGTWSPEMIEKEG